MRLPVKITRTRKCPRCRLRYPLEQPGCPHCTGLSDAEVQRLRDHHKRQHAANAELGRVLLGAAALLIAGMAVLLLLRVP